ncbi:MAG TPA: tRNA (adenosine(37)-N6)-dimethylallyltransferase MiaA, partial [Candidatus Dormibacteraeota bacterium]|nr:tRNA (adenosine(37)-N6)-dimethylallyltransferase MiaA [Candidatus Dormibacteraeota bacterium]
ARRVAGADASLPAQLLTRVPVIVGPTGIGKSQLAFELALRVGGEIVVADSRQVYERLDIATNKPGPDQRRRVQYHMIDFVDPAATFSVAQYVAGARSAIDDIMSRGHLPIVEGGTMLYVDALCDGFSLAGIPPNRGLRAELDRLDVAELRARLLAIDPDPGVDLQNPVRMIRALEILGAAGPPLRRLRTRYPPPWQAVRVGLFASLDVIDRRLEQRSREQVQRGLVEETQAALDAGVPPDAPVLTGIGYAEALARIRQELTLEELPVAMAASNRRYARRQLRWWRRDARVRWFEIEPDPLPGILKYLNE